MEIEVVMVFIISYPVCSVQVGVRILRAQVIVLCTTYLSYLSSI